MPRCSHPASANFVARSKFVYDVHEDFAALMLIRDGAGVAQTSGAGLTQHSGERAGITR